jgi:hypothetical protein
MDVTAVSGPLVGGRLPDPGDGGVAGRMEGVGRFCDRSGGRG